MRKLHLLFLLTLTLTTCGENSSSNVDVQQLVPEKATLTGYPEARTTAAALNVKVTGQYIETYAFVLLKSKTTCPDLSKSTYVAKAKAIVSQLDTDGDYTLCVLGQSSAGLFSPAATKVSFTKYTVDPESEPLVEPDLTLLTSGNLTPANGSNNSLAISYQVDPATLDSLSVSVKKDNNDSACLNTAKTAFTSACPNWISADISASGSFSIPFSTLASTASLTISLSGSNGSADPVVKTTSATWTADTAFYLGIQNSSGNAFAQPFNFNVNTNAVVLGSAVYLNPYIATDSLRGMAKLSDGRVIVGSSAALSAAFIATNGSVSAGPAFTTGGSPANLNDLHGICQLPDGSYIIGAYGGGSGAVLQHFSSTSVYLRNVYTTTINSLTDCKATSSTEVFLVDYDADNDSDGDVVRLTLSGGVWSVASRWDQSAAGLGALSSIYSIILHSNGNLYAAPQNDSGARNRKMIRCLNKDLSQCSAIGTNIMNGSQAFLQAMVQIPGSNDLLLASSSKLWRYDVGTGTATALSFNMATIPNISQVRHLLVK